MRRQIIEKSLKIILTKVHDYVAVSSVLDHHTIQVIVT